MPVEFRTGLGWDVHRIAPGRPLILGGVTIPSDFGLDGHSDADILSHAVTDALLGAAGLGDIGMHFPDTDPQWKGAKSERFVAAAVEMLTRRGYRIVNADLTLLAEKPRISLYRDEIRRNVAMLLQLPESCVNLKATTTEQLGFVGRSEGLMAMATVLIDDIKPG